MSKINNHDLSSLLELAERVLSEMKHKELCSWTDTELGDEFAEYIMEDVTSKTRELLAFLGHCIYDMEMGDECDENCTHGDGEKEDEKDIN